MLLFAAGNAGGTTPPGECSVMSPATGKNAIAVGSSISGPLRYSFGATVDEVSDFSGHGPLPGGRIKPDVNKKSKMSLLAAVTASEAPARGT